MGNQFGPSRFRMGGSAFGSGGSTAITLRTLLLSTTSIVEDVPVTINIQRTKPGSTLTVASGTLPTGLTLDSAARTISGTPTTVALSAFTLRETLAEATNSPNDTPLEITVTAGPPTLVDLSLSASTAPLGEPVEIDILGATAGSTITLQAGALPDGLTLDSAARTISGTATVEDSFTFTLRETLTGATNSPHDTAGLGITVAPAVTVPIVVYDDETEIATMTNWADVESPEWVADGVSIPGETGATLDYSTLDGNWIGAAPGGNLAYLSNLHIVQRNTLLYAAPFQQTPATPLGGLDGWTTYLDYGPPASNDIYITSADGITQDGPRVGLIAVHSAPNGLEQCVQFSGCVPYADNAPTYRELLLRYTHPKLPSGTYIQLAWNYSVYGVVKRTGSGETTLQGFTSWPDGLLQDTDVGKFQVDAAGVVRLFLNGVEVPDSVAGSWDASDVPSSAFIEFQGAGGDGGFGYPFVTFATMEEHSIPANSINLTSLVCEPDGSGEPDGLQIRAQGTITGTPPATMEAMLLTPDGALAIDWTGVAWTSGTTFDIVLPGVPLIAQGGNCSFALRDVADIENISTSLVDVPVTAVQIPMTLGMNVSLYPWNDLMRSFDLYCTRQGSWRPVKTPAYEIDESDNAFVDATSLGIGANYTPTKFPNDVPGFNPDPLVDFPFYASGALAHDADIPASIKGAYDFAVYDENGDPLTGLYIDNGVGTAITSFTYSPATGLGTFTLGTGTGAAPTFALRGYDDGGGYQAGVLPSGNWYIKAIKQGADTSQLVLPEVKESLATLVSPGGFIRFMGSEEINIDGRSIVSFPGFDAWRPNNATGNLSGAQHTCLDEMLEIVEYCNANLHICIPNIANPTCVTAIAEYLYANKPAGCVVQVEYSNEMDNFSPGFYQSDMLSARAIANGNSLHKQYILDSREFCFDPFIAVFGSGNPGLTFALNWFIAGLTSTMVAQMLDEGDLYLLRPCFMASVYVGGGLGGSDCDLGNYDVQGIFTGPERDIVATDVAQYKTNFFAAQATMSDLALAAWNQFCNWIAQYSVSKGEARDYIVYGSYEYQWQHCVPRNNPAPIDVETRTAQAECLLDARAGLAQATLNDGLYKAGGRHIGFAHTTVVPPILPNGGGVWNFYTSVYPGGLTEPGLSQADWILTNL